MGTPHPENPLVSVLIPAFNAEKYISDTLSDILNQTFLDFEVIVIDDGSTDNTADLVLSIPDTRIRLFKNKSNSGQVVSLNYGLELCRGKFIARMDADDRCSPTRLEKQVSFLLNHEEAGLCLSWYKILGTEKVIKTSLDPDEFKVLMFFRNQVGNSTVMIRKSTIDRYNFRYSAEIPVAEDYFFWTTILSVSKAVIIPEVLMEYREHPGQTSEIKKDLIKFCTDQVRLGMLHYLGISATDQEKDIHLRLISSPFFSSDDIMTVFSWIDYLKRKNSEIGFFHSGFFNSELEKRELLIWKRLNPDSKTWSFYTSWKKDHFSIGLKNELKLFLRCVKK